MFNTTIKKLRVSNIILKYKEIHQKWQFMLLHKKINLK